MKTTPVAPKRCDSCGAGEPEPLERAVLAGIPVWMCVKASPCLNRARIARVGMWAA